MSKVLNKIFVNNFLLLSHSKNSGSACIRAYPIILFWNKLKDLIHQEEETEEM
jgi:hypothetical protein